MKQKQKTNGVKSPEAERVGQRLLLSYVWSKEQINPDQRASDSCLYYKAAVYYNVISCLDVRGFKHGYKDLALDSEFDVQLA